MKISNLIRTIVLLFLAVSVSIVISNYNSNINHESSYEKPNLRQIIEGRGAHEFLMTHDPATNTIPKERLIPAKEYTQQLLSQKNAIPNVNWEERGPNNVSGRTRAILIDAGDPTGNTIFAGGVGGGLWRSTDDGASWTQVDDFLDNLAINSITQDPNSSDIIYFGTGEGYGNIDAIRGLGIWKSTDGGLSFSQLSFTNDNPDFYYVNSLAALDLGNSTVLLAACANLGGIHRSTDGGTTWTEVLSSSSAMDLTVASNGDVFCGLDINGIYKSSNDGLTWTEVYNGSGEGRIELAAAPSNSSVVYALIEGMGSNLPTIRRTSNAGTSWPLVSNPVWNDQNCATPNPDWTRGQDWYDLIAAVDPNDEDRVFVGGVDLFGSEDGGSTWTQISSWAGACSRQFLHADQHALVFAGNSNELWSGNDGGVFKTDDATSTIPSFSFKGDGFNVTQFYACDIHPGDGEHYFLAGAQDNGTQKFTSDGLNNTTSATGGDGGFCHIDQDDPNIQITSFTRNNYSISLDGGQTWNSGPSLTTGLFINPTDYDDETKILYASNSGANYLRWEDPSSGGTTTTTVTVPQLTGSVTHVRTSPNVSNRVYFGTSSGRVVRVNTAHTGNSKTGEIIFNEEQGSISCVDVEVGNEDHMLVTLSNYGVSSVWETFDATAGNPTWIDVENNLPDIPVRWALFNPDDGDQAMLATEVGVWSTDDLDGVNTDWTPTNTNLANTRIDMLKRRESDDVVIAATHGRGLFSTLAFNNKLFFTKTTVSSANANDILTYELEVFNNLTTSITNVTITDVLDPGLEYIDGSLTCGSFAGNTITINQASMAPGETLTCTFMARADIDNFATVVFEDDIEGGTGNWTTTNGQGAAVWSVTNSMSNSPSQSWFAPNAGNEDNTEYLNLNEMTLSADAILTFWHKYDTEEGWDGGMVEISMDGGSNWIDLGPFMIENGYNSTLGTNANLDIAGRNAFSGNSGGFIKTSVDLSSFGAVDAEIRFLFGEDDNTSEDGWYVDDVQLLAGHIIENIATLTTDEGDMLADTTNTAIFECEVACFSCTDGIQNGAETGVDCGGPECDSCDCSDTNTSLTYDDTTIADGTNEFIKTMITTANDVNILDGSIVSLKAGNRFELEPGFLIEDGATVEMIIDDCNLPPPLTEGNVKKQ